jgi:hypothetical protein
MFKFQQYLVMSGTISTMVLIATVGSLQIPSVFAAVPAGCTGNPHDSDSGPTGNPHDPGETGNPHDAASHGGGGHQHEGDTCPGS